jgi:hypothetical protein
MSVWNPEPLERYRHRWEDNIQINLAGLGYEDVDWIHLVQGRVQWQALVKGNESLVCVKTENLLTNWATLSFSSSSMELITVFDCQFHRLDMVSCCLLSQKPLNSQRRIGTLATSPWQANSV